MSTMTIALLGQPNSGKSTLFNGLTGSKQHVGNWPGKTVEKKEGYFYYKNKKYQVVDLPGTYSLSANSEEEIVTRSYIGDNNVDLVCILVDASQLERSSFMLADYAGIKTPAVLLLNMADVAEDQGKIINVKRISEKLGIPAILFTASNKKSYGEFFEVIEEGLKRNSQLKSDGILKFNSGKLWETYEEILKLLPDSGMEAFSSSWLALKLLEQDEIVMDTVKLNIPKANWNKIESIIKNIENGSLLTADSKFKWIGTLIKDSVKSTKKEKRIINKFDKIATSNIWGKPLAIFIMVLGLVFSMAVAMPIIGVVGYVQGIISSLIYEGLIFINAPGIIVSLICDGIITAISFAFMMVSFVFGISLVFGFIEEIGYMARISYVFDNVMSKIGLQGKAIMPFLVSFGCNIGGVTGTRVIDSLGQRILTIALSWVIPCAGTWSVVGLVSVVFFGSKSIIVILSLFAVAIIHMLITSKIFGKFLINENDRSGLIMELPPYHKPKFKNLLKFVINRMSDVLVRALKVIIIVAVLFWALSYTSDGKIEGSIIYKIGIFIEPVTMWFGLRWQTFMAFIAAAMGKEAALGVLASLFNAGSSSAGVWSVIAKSVTVSTEGLAGVLSSEISQAEALAFIYAFFFNIPCLMTVASTYQESHSLKWTLRIVGYYMVFALLMSAIAYNVGMLIF